MGGIRGRQDRRAAVPVWVRALGRRAAVALGLWVGVFLGSFLLFDALPGDPARTILGPNATEEAVRRLRTDLGTDRPLPEQLARKAAGLLRFDLGRSVIDGRKVAGEVSEKFLVTARLAILSSAFALLLSYLVNLGAYLYRLPALVSIAKVGAVVPTYCSGVFAALLFGTFLPVVPLTGSGDGAGGWTFLLLPATIAAAYPAALMSGILFEKVRAASTQGYARTVEALGFSRGRIYHGTILRAVSVSWLTAWINNLSVVFVASFVLEIIFSIPGTGVLLVRTIQEKDYPMLQGILLLNAAFFLSVAWLSDALFRALDPRTRNDAEE